jgi:hypothetical protein
VNNNNGNGKKKTLSYYFACGILLMFLFATCFFLFFQVSPLISCVTLALVLGAYRLAKLLPPNKNIKKTDHLEESIIHLRKNGNAPRENGRRPIPGSSRRLGR